MYDHNIQNTQSSLPFQGIGADVKRPVMWGAKIFPYEEVVLFVCLLCFMSATWLELGGIQLRRQL